jgi:hypothetical protein
MMRPSAGARAPLGHSGFAAVLGRPVNTALGRRSAPLGHSGCAAVLGRLSLRSWLSAKCMLLRTSAHHPPKWHVRFVVGDTVAVSSRGTTT